MATEPEHGCDVLLWLRTGIDYSDERMRLPLFGREYVYMPRPLEVHRDDPCLQNLLPPRH